MTQIELSTKFQYINNWTLILQDNHLKKLYTNESLKFIRHFSIYSQLLFFLINLILLVEIVLSDGQFYPQLGEAIVILVTVIFRKRNYQIYQYFIVIQLVSQTIICGEVIYPLIEFKHKVYLILLFAVMINYSLLFANVLQNWILKILSLIFPYYYIILKITIKSEVIIEPLIILALYTIFIILYIYQQEKYKLNKFLEAQYAKKNHETMKNLLNKAFPTTVFVVNCENLIDGGTQDIKVSFINEKCKAMFNINAETELLQKMEQIISVEETKSLGKQINEGQINVQNVQLLQQPPASFKPKNSNEPRISIEEQISFIIKPGDLSKVQNSKNIANSNKSDIIIQKKRMNASQKSVLECGSQIQNQSDYQISLKSYKNNEEQVQLSLLKVIQQKINNHFSRSHRNSTSKYNESVFIPKDNVFIKCYQNINEESNYYDIDLVECQWQEKKSIMCVMNDVTFQVKNLRLKALDNYKDGLLYSVAHDLRNPIGSIQQFLDLALKSEMQEERENYIGKCIKICNLALSMTKDLVDLSQINKGQLRLNYTQFNLESAIKEVFDILRFQAENKKLKLDYFSEIPVDQLDISNDQNRLKQILMNLIGNAIKFTYQGYVKTLVEPDFKHADCLRISVEDTGTGIPEHIKKRLFLPFATFEHSGVNNKHGVGLGLTICKSLSKYIGPKSQSIIVKSKEGEGSTFSFLVYKSSIENSQVSWMNISEHVQDRIVPKQKFQTMKKKTENQLPIALVVDDEQFNRLPIKKFLEMKKFRVFEANNGQEALKVIKQQQKIQIVFLDLNMPIMDGLETIIEIKSLAKKDDVIKKMKIVIVSGYQSDDEKNKCLLAGANEYLVKGFKCEELDKILKKYFPVK